MSKEVYVEIPERTPLAVASRGQRSPRWSARRRRDAWFLLGVLLLGVVTLITLAHGGASSAGQAHGTQSVASPVAGSLTQPPTTSAITATGQFREYPLPQSDSQVMRLAIDHEGRVWFGEMGRNYLAVFDPRTRTFEQMTPPHGRYGMMGMQVAPDNTIWFAEQYANYIGHYFPATGQFQTYPLPTLTVPDPGLSGKTLTLPSAPNDLVLDNQGDVWFTELNANALGRLHIQSGQTQQYPLATTKTTQALNPYGITIDPQGNVWFTEASTNQIGRLDPKKGQISYFSMQGSSTPLMEITADAHGIIWATSFSSGLLLSFNPKTATFTPYYAPSSGGLYGITITPGGQVWVTITAANAIAHLDPTANRFIDYAIPTSGSLPLGVVMGANDSLWFTEAGSNKIGMLKP